MRNVLTQGKSAYVAIADSIRERINRHEYKPGDKLPAERDLMIQFGVARMTVRNALDVLQLEGLIERRRGRTGGTFVRGVLPTVDLSRGEAIRDQLQEHFDRVGFKILSIHKVFADQAASTALNVPVGDPLVALSRVWTINDTPLMVEYLMVPEDYIPGWQQLGDAREIKSFTTLFEQRWGIKIAQRRDVLFPSVATGEEQEILEMNRNTPLLRIDETMVDQDGRPVTFGPKYLRTDLVNARVVTDLPVPDA